MTKNKWGRILTETFYDLSDMDESTNIDLSMKEYLANDYTISSDDTNE